MGSQHRNAVPREEGEFPTAEPTHGHTYQRLDDPGCRKLARSACAPRDCPGHPACEPAAQGWAECAASNTPVPPTFVRWQLSPPHCSDGTSTVYSPAVILLIARRRLPGFHQQITHHAVALFAYGAKPLPASAAAFARIQSQITNHLFAAPEAL